MGRVAVFFTVVFFLLAIAVLAYLMFRSYKFKGYFYADDLLTVMHNDETVYSSQKTYDHKHYVTIDNVKPNDEITFIVKNTGGPGGFIGYFTWKNQLHVVNKELFNTMITITDRTPWATLDMANFPPAAEWIWSADRCTDCTNTFKWIAVVS